MSKKLVVINVLNKDMYNDCHIKGSINIPLGEIDDYVKTLDRDTHVIVYCASYECSASAVAWRTFNALGFVNTWAYEGGTNEWHYAGLPTEGACNASYLAEKITTKPERKGVRSISLEEMKKMMQEHGLL